MSRTVSIAIGSYSSEGGLRLVWEDGFEIDGSCEDGEMVIRANGPGLVSLARHLSTLAEDGVPSGSHIHLSAGQELEDSSLSLILERS